MPDKQQKTNKQYTKTKHTYNKTLKKRRELNHKYTNANTYAQTQKHKSNTQIKLCPSCF